MLQNIARPEKAWLSFQAILCQATGEMSHSNDAGQTENSVMLIKIKSFNRISFQSKNNTIINQRATEKR